MPDETPSRPVAMDAPQGGVDRAVRVGSRRLPWLLLVPGPLVVLLVGPIIEYTITDLRTSGRIWLAAALVAWLMGLTGLGLLRPKWTSIALGLGYTVLLVALAIVVLAGFVCSFYEKHCVFG